MPMVIDTTGESVGEQTSSVKPEAKDIPVYTVAHAIDWMKRPENQDKIERAAKAADDMIKQAARNIDHEVTKVGRLMVDITTDENAYDDFVNSFLKSLVGDD